MKEFMRNPEKFLDSESYVISDLIYGWGNSSWGAAPEYLVSCMQHALVSNGPILECGSGLSTILIGIIARKRGITHWALEHMPVWGERVQKCLNAYQIYSVVLCVKSLKDYDNFSWYDPPLESMPDRFTLVICDGPPGSIRGGRYGLVPIMKERLKPGCVILLDDAAREQEQTIAGKWEAELGASSEILGSKKPYIRLMVGDVAD